MKIKVKHIAVITKSYKSFLEVFSEENLEDFKFFASYDLDKNITVLNNFIEQVELTNGNYALINSLVVMYDGFLISDADFKKYEDEIVSRIKDIVSTISIENKLLHAFID